MKKHLVLILAAAVAGCKSAPKDTTADDMKEEAVRPRFEQGMRALDQNRFQDAARIFDQLLVAKPGTELDLITLYNSGAAYEGLGDCTRGAERFREVVRSSAGKFLRLESQSLYRLSFMYECLGQDNKSITALLDARKRGRDLPMATLQAEIPARLAAGYARIGNRTKALEYFALASKGLKKLLAIEKDSGKRQFPALAQSLFFMGQLNPAQRRAEGDPVIFLQGLSLQQPYLLQAAELNVQPWSQKAGDDLESAYANIFNFKIEDEKARREFYTRGIQVANELKRIRSPKNDPVIEQIYAKVDATLNRFQSELAKVAESNKLTSEAQKREGLKRQGRLVDPEPKSPKKSKK